MRRQKKIGYRVGNLRRRRFLISVEGTDTEVRYFKILNKQPTHNTFKVVSNGGAPLQVLKNMTDYIDQTGLEEYDEAWLVVDTNSWKKQDLTMLNKWTRESNKYNLAVSNPCFEFWLILHYNPKGKLHFSTSRQCKDHFKAKYCNKNGEPQFELLSYKNFNIAIQLAKSKEQSSQKSWPVQDGCTTVYKLVERYFEKT